MADTKQATSPSGESVFSTTLGYFESAWKQLTDNLNLWVGLWLLAVLPTIVLSVLVALMFGLSATIFIASAPATVSGLSLGTLALAMSAWAVLVGFYNVFIHAAELSSFLQVNRGKKVTLQQAIEAGKANFTRLLIVGLLMVLFIVLGLIALIIPGLILAVLFSYAPLIAIDNKKLSAMDTLKASSNLVTSKFMPLLVFVLVAFVLTFAVGLVAGVVGNIFPDELKSILQALVNGAMTIYVGLAFTKLYLSLK